VLQKVDPELFAFFASKNLPAKIYAFPCELAISAQKKEEKKK